MRNVLALIVFSVTAFSLGCSHFDSEARKHTLAKEDAYWFDYTANRRGSIMVFKNSTTTGDFVYLAEPSPDSAKQIMDAFSAKVNYQELGVEAQANLADKIVQLAQRSQTVQFLRESMYRLSELSVNGQFDKEDMKYLYEKVLDAAILMAGQEFETAKEASAKAETELLKIKKASSTLMEDDNGK